VVPESVEDEHNLLERFQRLLKRNRICWRGYRDCGRATESVGKVTETVEEEHKLLERLQRLL